MRRSGAGDDCLDGLLLSESVNVSCSLARGVVAFNDKIEPVGLTVFLNLADSSQSGCFPFRCLLSSAGSSDGVVTREILADEVCAAVKEPLTVAGLLTSVSPAFGVLGDCAAANTVWYC